MNPSRVWLEREIELFARQIPPGGLILDAGAGEQPYRSKFDGRQYESADFEQVAKRYAKSTYVCDLAAIPVEDGRYDAVLFTQVMEHLPDPNAVVRELSRVLKTGGLLFFSAPLFYEEHEKPFDFYRYTQFGVKYILEKSGFKITEMRWLEGYMGTLHYQLKRFSKHVPPSPLALGGNAWGISAWILLMLLKPLARLTASVAGRCDVRFRYTDSGFPINYVAIAQKL